MYIIRLCGKTIWRLGMDQYLLREPLGARRAGPPPSIAPSIIQQGVTHVQPLARLAAGALAGAALLSVGLAAAPATASASGGGFCSETPSYICCCSTNDDGSINDCTCMPKTAPQPT
jgi:hypothetical protein